MAHTHTALVLNHPQATSYHKSRLIDTNTGMPIMLPNIPGLAKAQAIGRQDGKSLKKAIAV